MQEERCHECGKTMSDTRLGKCPVCFKWFCEDHGTYRGGREFCSRGCADYFFFGDDE